MDLTANVKLRLWEDQTFSRENIRPLREKCSREFHNWKQFQKILTFPAENEAGRENDGKKHETYH